MTPQAFIAKWRDNSLTERAGAQAHFEDLCALLGVEPPRIEGEYQYERGLTKTGSASQGWADVWKRGCFAWEYKQPNADLGAALRQLMIYTLSLDSPPLLVVSDRKRIEIHTHFTGTPSEVHTILLEDIGQPEFLQKLRWLFDAPERFKPALTTHAVTEAAARKMGALAERLNTRGGNPLETAHFLIQCVFCMFAEDARLLPQKLFETVLDKSNPDGTKAQSRLAELFAAMRRGGDFALETIPYFNGGLFEEIKVPALTTEDVVQLLDAARMSWSDIEPAILGTLFERGLNPDMRSQLGAHYTDPATILKLIRPVIEQPLMAEWQGIRAQIERLAPQFAYLKGKKRDEYRPNDARLEGQRLFNAFLEKLKAFRVLDPACGSGNFLYLALKTLKDIEHRANLDAEALGLLRELAIETNPANVLGIELNPYAAELARVTIWIGEIQWMLAHGYPIRRDPILRPLDHIENRDAVLIYEDGGKDSGALIGEPEWPGADVIVGNPPFLGDKKMRAELGDDYTRELRLEYAGRVPGGADFVTYWFEKARAQIEAGKAKRAGLVATNSIRQKGSRIVLERIAATTAIFEAWSDEEWVNAGAAVRVSLVCFGEGSGTVKLDGEQVAAIYADLTTGSELDLTQAKALQENIGWSYFGLCLAGAFKVPATTAHAWLGSPNPHGKPNSDVLKPIYNGTDITRRWAGDWLIDFGTSLSEQEAAFYEAPFAYVTEHVKPVRASNREAIRANKWWRLGRPRPELRSKLSGVQRYIVTPETAKYRVFVWLSTSVSPEHRLVVIPCDDDIIFGLLSSRIHVVWALAQGGTLEDRPVYNTSRCFETFPFPEGLTPSDTVSPSPQPSPLKGEGAERIADAAKQLNALRETWLNPPEWVDWVRTKEEEQAGFPLRPVAKPGHEAELKKRTLTNLYNARPAWLDHAHRDLDAAVAAAYGWTDYTPAMPDEDILRRLLALNLARAG